MARTGIKRSDIIEHARSVLDRFGPGKTNMADIAARMHTSPANLYRFFPSKSALIEAVTDTLLDELRRRIDENVRAHVVGWPQIAEAVRTIALFHWDLLQKDRAAETISAAGSRQLQRPAAADRFLLQMRRMFCGLLEEGVEAGRFRALDPEVTALSLIDAVALAYDLNMMPLISREEYGQRVEALLDLLFRGLAKKALPNS